MGALNEVSGLGMVKIGDRWMNAYYRQQPGGIGTRETWVVRIGRNDFDALGLRPGQAVRLRVPPHAPRDVTVLNSWFQSPFIWLEFEWTPSPTEVTVDAAEIKSERFQPPRPPET